MPKRSNAVSSTPWRRTRILEARAPSEGFDHPIRGNFDRLDLRAAAVRKVRCNQADILAIPEETILDCYLVAGLTRMAFEQDDYSITWSARSRRDCGMVPIASSSTRPPSGLHGVLDGVRHAERRDWDPRLSLHAASKDLHTNLERRSRSNLPRI